MQTCNSKLKLFDLLDNLLWMMRFLFVVMLFFEKTIEFIYRNDGVVSFISNTAAVFYS